MSTNQSVSVNKLSSTYTMDTAVKANDPEGQTV